LWSDRWNENWQGKLKYSEKTCPSDTLFTTNSTWPDPGSNPGCCGGKPATNRLSHGAQMVDVKKRWCPPAGVHGGAVNMGAHEFIMILCLKWNSHYLKNQAAHMVIPILQLESEAIKWCCI
jgi:hypothetical protein